MGSQHEEIVRVVGGHDSDGNDSGNASPEYTIDGGEVLEVDPTMVCDLPYTHLWLCDTVWKYS